MIGVDGISGAVILRRPTATGAGRRTRGRDDVALSIEVPLHAGTRSTRSTCASRSRPKSSSSPAPVTGLGLYGSVVSADRLSRVADRRSPHDLEPLREPPPGCLLLTDEHRPTRGRKAGDATGQRCLRCRGPGHFPPTFLERLPRRDEE